MKFTAPDGKEFESKVELRKYVMDKFYSFKNKENDDQLIKRPGEINQQVFEISDCKHCTIVILDVTDQTYIDNLSNCRVFIGACSSSIFVRDCKQCVFFTCSRQLRINNVVSSSFYSFTLSEIHMELSSALQFGPFRGGYDMQSQHFEQNGFDVNDNLWFEVYDHNDPDKLQTNWRIIEPKSYEPAWFPLGPCRAFIKLIEPKKIGIESKVQVGESFGLDQMIADSKKISKEKSLITTTIGPKKIPIESALLVVTAENNDIDLDVWFKVEALQGRVKTREFNDLLCSLSATMSINQSPSTKSELDAAVSKGALKCIEHVCGITELDEDGSRLIDVVSFFERSRVIVDEYMQGFNEELSVQEADGEGIGGDSIAAVTNENDLDEFDPVLQSSQYDCFSNDIDRYRDSALVDFQAYDESADDAMEYLRDIREIANRTRPQSAPAGHGGQHLVGLTAITTTSGLDEKVSLKLPSSPYDEEIDFEHDDDDDEEEDFTYIKSRQVPPSLEQFWEEENQRYLMQSASFTDVHIPITTQTRNGSLLNTSVKNNNLRPRPSSAGPRIRGSAVGATTAIGARRGRQTQSISGGLYNPVVRVSSSDSRLKLRNSFSGPITRHDPIKTKIKIPSSDKLSEMKDMVEDLIRNTVKKADLYHMIQVYLGYIDSYTMVPPRGSIIKSRQREWFTSRDLQTAFMAARLYLSEPQLIILRSLVHAFSQQHQQQHRHVHAVAEADGARPTTVETELDKLHKVPVIGSAHSLNAQWLKRYLIHLRLTKKLKSAAPPPPSANPPMVVADPPTKEVPRVSMGSASTDQDRSPVPWKVWLGRKLKKEVRSGLTKPKEFERALSGLNHPLGKEDIELMLRTYSVLPPEVLQQEVECRIESWLLDMDGRRDFQHELNVNLRRWIWNKVRDEKIKLPTAEKGYWHVWESLPEDQKKVVKGDILNMIIQQKREELLSKERTKQVITRELYWKFDEKRGSSSRGDNWTTFLSNHIKSFKKALEDFRVNENDRLKRLAAVKSKKKTVAGLSEVESKLKKMQPNMDSYHQIELQKAINALRRTALINNVAKGTVITKEAFDEHLKDLLAPYIIIKKQKQKASSSRTSSASSSSPSSKECKDSNDLSGIFHSELKKAVDRVVELESERSRNSKVRYLEWLNEKDFQRSQELKRLQETQQREKEQQAIKEKQNRKEFRKWNRLHRNNKYRSMVDQKPRPLPPAKTIQHSVKWNNEVDMAKLYFEREQKS